PYCSKGKKANLISSFGGEMSVKRRKYSPAEKAKIALEAIKGELTMAQIIAKYGVHVSAIQIRDLRVKNS
ncbi:MAG: hypothetical protein COY58_08605, partial [Gammaproteobacteria bacterium CG_4_10_14_0_8_um_filter_38_16]